METSGIDHVTIRPSLVSQDWHGQHCYGCGPENPHSLHADFNFDELTGEVRFDFQPPSFALGAPGYVHGGVLASIMDEAQGVLCFHVGHVVMTDELHMKYHKATALDKPFRVSAWITAVRKRRMYTHGSVHSLEGELLVSSRAVWYLLPERIIQRMMYAEYHAEYDRIKAIIEANRRRAKNIRKRLRAEKK